jgi:hypothetical protein
MLPGLIWRGRLKQLPHTFRFILMTGRPEKTYAAHGENKSRNLQSEYGDLPLSRIRVLKFQAWDYIIAPTVVRIDNIVDDGITVEVDDSGEW